MSPDTAKLTFDFNLSTPLPYASQGAQTEAMVLVMKAPSNLQRRWTTILKQGFFQALNFHKGSSTDAKELAGLDVSEEAGEDDMTPEQLLALIFMSNIDADKFVTAFKDLILSPGVCMVDGKQQLTAILYDKMSDYDTDQLMGEYLNNFFIGSLMKSLNK